KKDGSIKKQQAGKTLNASETTKGIGLSDFHKLFEKNTHQKQQHLKNVRGRVFSIYNPLKNNNKIIGLDDFRTSLLKKGIKLNVLRAKSGALKDAIIGVSFTDQKTSIKYNGEEIKLKWSELSKMINDDFSDLKEEKELNHIKNEIPNKVQESELLSEIAKVFKHNNIPSPNDYQEDLRKKKKKRRFL
ncbi:hypothetical protein JM658_16660, partial [Joostella atrarenae]